jgi:hypothetical protein
VYETQNPASSRKQGFTILIHVSPWWVSIPAGKDQHFNMMHFDTINGVKVKVVLLNAD